MPIILYELPCFLILPAWYGLSSAYYNYTHSKVKYSFSFFSVIIAPAYPYNKLVYVKYFYI